MCKFTYCNIKLVFYFLIMGNILLNTNLHESKKYFKIMDYISSFFTDFYHLTQ